VILHDQVQQ